MQTKKLSLLVFLTAFGLQAHGQEPPASSRLFSTAGPNVLLIEVGQYIQERHDFPDKYKNVQVESEASKERAHIATLRFLKTLYDAGKGAHHSYLEITGRELSDLMGYIGSHLDNFTIGYRSAEKEVCGDFNSAYESGFRNTSFAEIKEISQRNIDNYNNNQQASHRQFMAEVSTDFGDDVKNQLEFFLDKNFAHSSITTSSTLLMVGADDASQISYFQSLCQ